MTNWKTLAISGILVILPVSVYAAKAQSNINQIQSTSPMEIAQRSENARGKRGQRMEKLLQNLDLTDEQSQQVKAIQEQSATTVEDIREQIQAQRQEMQSLFASDANTDEIRSQFQASQQLRQQLSTNRFETMLQIREILTPEQREKAVELMEQRHQRRFEG
ncbi:MAG: Spy/CpxP family protein refolding chaperone [Cyanobacteria bacterium P01_A01_bin.83]